MNQALPHKPAAPPGPQRQPSRGPAFSSPRGTLSLRTGWLVSEPPVSGTARISRPQPRLLSGGAAPELTGAPVRRHLQSPLCRAFRHVKVDTLSQPEALSRILVPGRRQGLDSMCGEWGHPGAGGTSNHLQAEVGKGEVKRMPATPPVRFPWLP